MATITERKTTSTLLYPFHHVAVEDYWDGVYGGWRSVLAELLGTMMYVFCSAGVAIATNTFDYVEADYHRSLLIIALGDGLAFTCFVFAFMRLSGGHLNPTITLGAIITRRIGLMKGIAYMLAQVGGGILGALLICGATPDTYHGRLGSTFWDASLSRFGGFLLITVLCAFLVMVVLTTQYDPQHIGKLAPLPIGLTVVFSDLVGYVFVGPFLNPARALATGIVYGSYLNARMSNFFYLHFFLRPLLCILDSLQIRTYVDLLGSTCGWSNDRFSSLCRSFLDSPFSPRWYPLSLFSSLYITFFFFPFFFDLRISGPPDPYNFETVHNI